MGCIRIGRVRWTRQVGSVPESLSSKHTLRQNLAYFAYGLATETCLTSRPCGRTLVLVMPGFEDHDVERAAVEICTALTDPRRAEDIRNASEVVHQRTRELEETLQANAMLLHEPVTL